MHKDILYIYIYVPTYSDIYIYIQTLSCTSQPSPTCRKQLAKEYKEWAQVSRNICTSFIHKLGVPLSKVWVGFFRMLWRWWEGDGVGPLTLDLTISSQFVGGSWEFGASDLGCGLSQKLGAGDALLPCSPGVEGKWTGNWIGWLGWV